MEPLLDLEFSGFVATGCGRTTVDARWHRGERATVSVFSRWMGDDAPLHISLDCAHHPSGPSYGLLLVERALDEAGAEVPLPPSDGDLWLEYIRIPPHEAPQAGCDAMAAAGHWTSPFSMLLWLHDDSFFDDGTELDPDEYDPPAERFAPAARALQLLQSPRKLAPR